MLVYKAQQVVGVLTHEPKPWDFQGKSGVTHSASLSLFGLNGDAVSIVVKAKTADELKAKLAKFPVGKPAEVPVTQVTPFMRRGENKPAAYEYVYQ
jgi:hypothetical protein